MSEYDRNDQAIQDEEFEDIDLSVEGDYVFEEQPGWAKFLAWSTIFLGGIYVINNRATITGSVFDISGLGTPKRAAAVT